MTDEAVINRTVRYALTADDSVLQCRTMGHAWALVSWGAPSRDDDRVWQYGTWSLLRRTECGRCGTGRDEYYPRDTIDPMETWRVTHRRYRYPDGYISTDGSTDRRALMRALYERVSEGD